MPRFTTEQLLSLTRDEEFQRRVASDPALNRAFVERDIDRSDELAETLVLLGGDYSGGGVSFRAPSPGVISMLWLARSPYVVGGPVSPIDVDAALLILTQREKAFDRIADIDNGFLSEAAGLCARIGVDADKVDDAITTALRQSVAGYQWFPSDDTQPLNESSDFGAEWLARLIASVTQVSRYTPHQIKWEVSMVECGYLVLQNARKNGVNGIAKKTRAGECMKRLESLMSERIAELNL